MERVQFQQEQVKYFVCTTVVLRLIWMHNCRCSQSSRTSSKKDSSPRYVTHTSAWFSAEPHLMLCRLQKEVKQIMQKRTAFETALVRRVPKKSDFLRYAAYEMDLEALRRKRVERLSMPFC